MHTHLVQKQINKKMPYSWRKDSFNTDFTDETVIDFQITPESDDAVVKDF